MVLYSKLLEVGTLGKPASASDNEVCANIEWWELVMIVGGGIVNGGRIEIDDNRIESAIRPLALGRKNYLFCGNDAFAYRVAIVYSLIATCKSAEVDPRIWMEDVLSKIPYYERDEKNMEELLPRYWTKSNQTCFE